MTAAADRTTDGSAISRVMVYILRRRPLARAPIGLFRARLGFLLGPRMMLLEHVGRRSGTARHAVLEILERPDRDRVVVTSGFGERAQWFRNLRAEPACRVSTGLTYRRPAHARRLPDRDAAAVFERYERSHPLSYRAFAGAIAELNDGDLDGIPVVELTLGPRTERP